MIVLKKKKPKSIKEKNVVIDWKNTIEKKVLEGNYKYKNLYIRLQKLYSYIGKT